MELQFNFKIRGIMPKHQFSERIKEEVKSAVKEFGSYQFDDKGPSEVMDFSRLLSTFSSLTSAEKVQVAKDLSRNQRGSMVLIELMGSVDLTYEEISQMVEEGHMLIGDWFDESDEKGGAVVYKPVAPFKPLIEAC